MRKTVRALLQNPAVAIVLPLTDVTMPKMNGLELADRVPGLDSHLPVFLMSGVTWCADRGFGCVAKLRSAELVERVRRVLDANTHAETRVPAA